MALSFTVIIILIIYFTRVTAREYDVVETSSGFLNGSMRHLGGNLSVWEFLGIPYASLSNESFRRATPINTTDMERSASEPGPLCLQPGLNGTLIGENDCLTLNIWTPINYTDESSDFPVLVYFHGGLFARTAYQDLEPKAIAALAEAVVVSVQYRLGVLGFLRLDPFQIPGNLGLWDQQLALQWIAKNIEEFGGNCSSVTLIGHEAGAASVGLHLNNRISVGYIKQAILLSGSPLNSWALRSNADSMTQMGRAFVANYLNCTSSTIFRLRSCLKNKSPHDVVKAQMSYKEATGLYEEALWGPILDENFISSTAHSSVERVPVLVGTTAQEAKVMVDDEVENGTLDFDGMENSTNYMIRFFPEIPHLIEGPSQKILFLRTLSGVDPNNDLLNRQRLVDAVGQARFYTGLNRWLDLYLFEADNPSIFLYEFAYGRASHGDDLPYVFGIPLLNESLRLSSEGNMSKALIDRLIAFITTGEVDWNTYSSADRKFIRIEGPSIFKDQKYGILREEGAFWNFSLPILKGLNGLVANVLKMDNLRSSELLDETETNVRQQCPTFTSTDTLIVCLLIGVMVFYGLVVVVCYYLETRLGMCADDQNYEQNMHVPSAKELKDDILDNSQIPQTSSGHENQAADLDHEATRDATKNSSEHTNTAL